MSCIKSKVWGIVLDLERLTLDQITKVSTLTRLQIHDELQNMVKEGYLTKEPLEGKSGRGCYQLTKDVEKRLEMVSKIESWEEDE